MRCLSILTYGDIYKQFIADTGMSESLIDDYRPCVKTYDVPTISDAIVVWLKNGSKIIYIYGITK